MVNGVLMLNMVNKILADYDRYVYLVVTDLNISCKYFKFYLKIYLDICGYSVNIKSC